MSNRDTFEMPDVVEVYCQLRELQKVEVTILLGLKDRLRHARMLDIGVGGGRTTRSFASQVEEYIGIDYSASMIAACRNRLSSFPANVSFEVCDARDMAMFPDHSFGFVLFSYNGIDYLSHEDRLRAFQEMKRVAERGALVCFSTHNLQSLRGPVYPRWSSNPARLIWRILRYLGLLLTWRPRKDLGDQVYAIIDDGAHESRLSTYYIMPDEQLNQLAALGFRNVRVFSIESGNELRCMSQLRKVRDRWLYFLCEVC